MPTIDVRTATESDRQAVIDVITLAFSTDPMARWSFPAPATYLAVMPDVVQAFGGAAFAHGTAHLVEGGSAAAMWLPPGVDPDGDRLAALAERHTPPAQRDDMKKIFEQMDSYHPAEPCWYLPLIGVDPVRQGRPRRGAASARARAVRPRGRARLPRVVQSPEHSALRTPRLRVDRRHPGRQFADPRADAAAAALTEAGGRERALARDPS